jgi:hypothetical protein
MYTERVTLESLLNPSNGIIRFNDRTDHYVRYASPSSITSDGTIKILAFEHRLFGDGLEDYLSGMHYEQGLSNNTIDIKDDDIHALLDLYLNVTYIEFANTGKLIKLKSCKEIQDMLNPLMAKGVIHFEKDSGDANPLLNKYHIKFYGFKNYYKIIINSDRQLSLEKDANLDDILFVLIAQGIDDSMYIKDIKQTGLSMQLIRPKKPKVKHESFDWEMLCRHGQAIQLSDLLNYSMEENTMKSIPTLESVIAKITNDKIIEEATYDARMAARKTVYTKKELDILIKKEFDYVQRGLDPTDDKVLYRKTNKIMLDVIAHSTFDRMFYSGSVGGRCEIIWERAWEEYDILSIRPYREDRIVFAGTSLNKALYSKYRFEVHMTHQAILNMKEPIKIPEDLLKWNHQYIQ